MCHAHTQRHTLVILKYGIKGRRDDSVAEVEAQTAKIKSKGINLVVYPQTVFPPRRECIALLFLVVLTTERRAFCAAAELDPRVSHLVCFKLQKTLSQISRQPPPKYNQYSTKQRK